VHNPHRNATLVGFVLLAALLGLPVNASASEYDPPGLYDVDYFKLQNGLDVVLKKRTHARNVAVRLVVNVGLEIFLQRALERLQLCKPCWQSLSYFLNWG